MKAFLKKLTERAALTAFNIFKERKIHEARNTLADGVNEGLRKTSIGLRFYLLGLFIAGGGAAGIVLLALARVCYYFNTTSMYKKEIHDALSSSTCLLTWVGALSFVLPLIVFLVVSSYSVWRKAFAAELEKKIRGK